MPRYAAVSCHVERPLDDECWSRFSALQARRRGGFRIAALMRPPDADAGEDERRWLERARAAAALGPLGHHAHFGGPERARPRAGASVEELVRSQAEWLERNGLAPTLFCAGGWYMDAVLAETVAALGYVDCSATAFRPRYLADGAARIEASRPARILLPSGARLLELPSTHSLGMAARAAGRPSLGAAVAHVYFHDTDLLSRTRRVALEATLAVLGRRRRATDLDALAHLAADVAPEVTFADVVA